jgi:hypothetical protein
MKSEANAPAAMVTIASSTRLNAFMFSLAHCADQNSQTAVLLLFDAFLL